jgi:predicted CXXCH cytochrome family protein
MKMDFSPSTFDIRYSIFCGSLFLAVWLGFTALAMGGSYLDSAHGNHGYGVNRSTLEPNLQGYATGNCAHCHDMHASHEGVKPAPGGGPAPQVLFYSNFNKDRTQNLYMEPDNFCFFCHSSDSGQQVRNQDYSTTFGGAAGGSGPQSIMEAFNQESYHNLFDIWTFMRNNPAAPWFTDVSNPCSACHNPHLAQRNWDGTRPGFPLLSAISRPNDRESLWGQTELMSTYVSYEAPYAFANSREPAGVGDPEGDNTPDYVGFCTSCHNAVNTIYSSTLNRHLKKINWGNTGEGRDKHGTIARDGEDHLREPYAAAAGFKPNFVLSCLDCHEPHGSPNIMLLRRRVNGENLQETVTSAEAMGHVCKRCHTDDQAAQAGTGQANSWEYVHHGASGAPYAKTSCTDCHTSVDPITPISCDKCHGHTMNDSWAGTHQTGRRTF